ncbi:MAG: hypothetical protein HY900_00105 [Deltaproteobacteria bacterium]|nr:hypothetical protein [Deltaproteobacteria bacterium]
MAEFSSPPKAARFPLAGRRPGAGPRFAGFLGLVALSAHLLLPLVYTCQSYRTRVHSCCSARPIPVLALEGSGQEERHPCPFCSALSPFKHARYASLSFVSPQERRGLRPLTLPPDFLAPPEELTSNPPRAPPFPS